VRGKSTVKILVLLSAGIASIILSNTVPAGSRVVEHVAIPEFQDWSTRHVTYPNWGFAQDLNAASKDPRARFSWRKREAAPFHRRLPVFPIHHPEHQIRPGMQRDWSINLGTAGTAPAMYPAKFTFDVTQTPSCANDYIVFPVAAQGSATQPNLVAFNNLYSGTGGGGTGYCNRTASGSDVGTSATVLWSYNVQGISGGGAVPTSPVISYDENGTGSGTRVAFVESLAGNPAHFHVLAFKNGDGKNAGNLQNVLTPVTISTFTTTAPAAGSGTATDLKLGTSTTGTDTYSSPYVDYFHDLAYVGNDQGILYRIKDVFCESNNADCTGGTKPAPSLDTTWGTGGALTVCTGALTGPVLDSYSMNVYVGCADGKLYSISQKGTINSIAVGDGAASKTYGGIVDPPVVDSVNGFVYAVSGSAGGGANGVIVQAKTSFASSVSVAIGAGNQCNMHAPVFSNAYYTSPTTTGSLIYVAGLTGVVSQPCSASSTITGDIFVYGLTLGGNGIMTAGTPADNVNLGGGPGAEWTPLAEFYNATTATDWLFVSALQSNQTNLASANITAGFPSGTGFGEFVQYGVGPSGIIVDNDGSSTTYPQAASIYFNALVENATCSNNTTPTVLTATGGCATKLTQATLQ
jgi:hypothetical protein